MTTEWLQCRNWEHWQTYRRDRNPPPWIKVHRRILQDMEWSLLTDAEKGQLVSIWILAADRNGQIPGDATILQRLLGLERPPNIQKFKDLGFVTPNGRHSDATLTPEGRHTDAPEAEAEAEESRTEENNLRASTRGAPSGSNGRAHRFDEFWSLYPTKRDKKKAREVWIRKRLDEKADLVLDDVRHRQRHDRQWQDGYIPLPSTYLRGERWEDEYSAGRPTPTNGKGVPDIGDTDI